MTTMMVWKVFEMYQHTDRPFSHFVHEINRISVETFSFTKHKILQEYELTNPNL